MNLKKVIQLLAVAFCGATLCAHAAAPTIVAIPDHAVIVDHPALVEVLVSDAETPTNLLSLTLSTSNPALIETNRDVLFHWFADGGPSVMPRWYITIAPTFGQTGTATNTVTVSDGTNTASTTFVLTVTPLQTNSARFVNTNQITIPTNGIASHYPSTNVVTGMAGTITNVVVTFSRFWHRNPNDLHMLLVSPSGQGMVLWSKVGGGGPSGGTPPDHAVTNVTATMTDAAPDWAPLPDFYFLWTEQFRPADYAAGNPPTNNFPAPAPAGPYAPTPVTNAFHDAFNGLTANGTWSLYIYDDQGPYSGAIDGGWSLQIGTSTGPSISNITNQTVLTNTTVGPLPFVINDPDTAVSNLVLTASSSNTNLVTTNNIVFGGSGTNRTVTITPNANVAGTSTITITVSDGTDTVSDTFLVTVSNGNFPPFIAAIPNKTTLTGRAVGPFNITVSDVETPVGSLVITGTSSNTNLVPNANIIVFNSGVQTLTVQPVDGLTGSAVITVNVFDGINNTSTNFTLTVNSPGVGTGIFNNTNTISLAAASAAAPYPSSNIVSGLTGNITNVTLTLKGLTHTAPNNLQMMLVSPGGQKTIFFSAVGGGSASGVTVTVDDSAFYQLPPAPFAILTGTYKSADFGHGTFPAPAPAGPYGADLTPFNGTSPNGAWTLYINAPSGVGSGSLAGWSLAISTDSTDAPPTISAITDKVTVVNTATAAIPFTIFDVETAASNLVLTAYSSATNLIPTNSIVFGGSGTNRTVTLTPAANQTGAATINIAVSDGLSTTSNSFQLFVSLFAGGTKSFTNSAVITIPAIGTATTYPSTNTVTGLGGIITNITVQLTGFTHTFVSDVNVLLVSPWGQSIRLMEHAGTNHNASNLNFVFSDAAGGFIPQNSNPTSGTFKPSAYPTNAIYPGAPSAPYATNLASFLGVNPNGNWLLYVYDSGPGDAGSIASWSLNIATAITGAQAPTLTDLTNRSIAVSSSTGTVGFNIFDLDTQIANLTVSAFSSNTNLVAPGNISLGGSGTNRTVTVTPIAGQAGAATITVVVSDGGLSASNSFLLTVSSPAAQVRVETAADGTGTVVPAQLLTTGSAITVYSIARDAFGNFITNIAAGSWSLTNVSGGVASSNLVAAGDSKSATFTGVAPGAAKIRATSGALTPGSSGYVTVYTPGNAAPTITAIANRTTLAGRATGPFNITIGDAETAVGSLTMTGSSSNTNLVPNANIVLFNNFVQTLTVQPADGLTGTATITITVSDGVNFTSTDFELAVTGPGAATGIYDKTNSISLPLTNVASVYPSTNNVSGLLGNITQVTLTLKSLTHSAPHDLEMMLVGPAGQKTVFFSHVGGGTATNITVTLDETAFYGLPPAPFAILSGTYKSADFSHDTFPAPAPAGPYGTDLTPFNGTAPNGDWQLFIMNDPIGTGSGTLAGGWSLAITTDTANTPPAISAISNQVTTVNTPTAALPFIISDLETASSNLVLTASSSATNLVALNKIVFGGSGTNRTVTVTPASNQLGSATITLAVYDGLVSVSNSFVLTVNRAPLIVTATNFSRGYGLTNPVLTGSIVGLQAGDNITATFATTATTNSPVGVYPITFTLSDPGSKLGNYIVTTNNGTLTVTNAPLTVTASSSNKVYGTTRTFAKTEFTITSGTLFNGNTLTNATLASAGTNAAAAVGSYPITVTNAVGVGATNYLITYATGTLTVGTANLLIAAQNTNKVYGATLLPTQFTATGLVNGDTVTNVSLASSGSISNAPAGSYAIAASGALGTGLTNYSIGYSNGTLIVGAANLLITALDTNKVYGVTLNPSVFTVAGLLNSDSVTNVTLASSGSVSNAAAGSYAITASGALGAGLTNYTIGYSNGTLTVNAAGLVITALDTNKVYGTTLLPSGFVAAGLLNGDSVTNVTLTSAGSGTNAPVGGYAINAGSALGAGLTNYSIGYSNGTLTVNAASLLVTTLDTNKVYGTTLNPSEFNVTGLLNSDTVTNVTLASAGSGTNAPVGGYAITAGGVMGTGLTNYSIGYSNGTLTVNAANLLITALDTNKTYGATLNPTEFTVTGLLNSDSVTNVTLTSAGSGGGAAVGSYPIVPGAALGLGLTNYNIGYSNGTLTVDAALILVITAHNTNKTYGSTLVFAGTEFTASGLIGGDTVTNVTLTSGGAVSNATVGGYAIVPGNAQGTGLGNYTIIYSNATLTVNAAGLLVTTHDTNKVYGTTLNPVAFTVSGLLNSDSVTNAVLSSAGSVSNAPAGGYPITASVLGVGLTNYAIGYSNGTLTVNAAGLLITAQNTNKIYGATLNPAAFAVAGLLNSDTVTNVTLTSAGSVSSATVGSYVINAGGALGLGLTNYAIGYSNGTLTVNAAGLLVTTYATNKVYGTTLNPVAFTVAGLLNSDSVTNVTLSSAGSVSNAVVGSYPITASVEGTGLTNYTIGYSNGTLTVNAAGLLITAGSTNKPYGVNHTFAGTEFTVSGLLFGDTVTNVTLTSSGAVTNAPVGVHAIVPGSAQGPGVGNYSLTYSNGTMTVTPVLATITAGNTNKIYGGSISFAGTEFTTSGLMNGDTVTNVSLSSAGAASNAPAGNYQIVAGGATGTGAGNYAFFYNFGTLIVSKANATVTAGNTNKVYGGSHAFAGTEFTVTGLLNGDAITNLTLASAGAATNAPTGNHFIIPSSLQGVGLTNYFIFLNYGTMTVNPANLVIAAAATNKVYGTTLNPVAFVANGLMNWDAVTNLNLVSAGSVSNAAVGNYAINASGAQGLGLTNYTIGYSNGTLTVNAAGLLVTTHDTNKIYGTTLNPVAFTVAGLLNSDSVTNVTVASAGSVSNAAVGGYPITASATGTGLTNYTIGYSNGTMTVNAAGLLITTHDTNKVYGTTLNPVAFTVSGLLNSDSVTNVTLTSAGSVSNAVVGGYPITAIVEGTGLTNYTIGYSNGTLTVNAAGLLVTTHNTNKVYGTTLNPVAFTVAGLLNSDSVTNVTLSSAGSVSNAPVGGYPITASATGTGLTNYTIGYSNGTLTVNAAGLLVTALDTNKIYGTTLNPVAFTVAGLLNSDTVTNVTLASSGSVSNAVVGSYPITASATGTGLTNYSIGYSNGTLTVNAAGLLVTTHNTNKVYGTTLNPVAFTVAGLLNSDSVTNVTLSSAGSVSNAPVGGYPITASATGTGLTNYSIGYSNGTLTVNAAGLLVTTHDTNKVYGTTLNPVAFAVAGLLNSDTVTNVTLSSAGSVSNATVGSYVINAGGALGLGLTNYAIGYSNGTLTVNAAGLLVTTHDTNKVYGTTLLPTAFTVAGLLNGDSVTNVTLTSAGSVSNAVVGGYPITASVAGTGLTNYTIGYSNGTLTVNAAGLFVTAGSTNKPYGVNHTFAGTEFTVSGLLFGDTVTNVTLTSSGAVSNAPVGVHAIVPGSAQGPGVGNYSLTYSNGTMTVTPALATITAGNTNKIYGGSISFAGTEFTTSGLMNGDTVTNVSLSSAGAASNAPSGNYQIVVGGATGTGAGNYTFFYNYATLNVGLASATLSAISTNKTYGSDHAFAGTEFTVTGLLNGDAITNLMLASAGAATNAAVGNYTITAASPQGIGLSNYSIFINFATMTVTPANLTVTANSTAKTAGSTVTFSGTEFVVAGLVNSDTVTSATLASTGAPAGAAAGTYPITVTNAAGSGLANYSIGYIAGALTVTNSGLFEITSIKATNGVVTITWNSVSNQLYQLQYNDDLTTTNWTDVTPTVLATGNSTSTTNAPGAVAHRFFRVKLATALAPAPAPQILSIIVAGEEAVVTWTSVNGRTYGLQYNDDLSTTNWADVLPAVTATGPTTSKTNMTGGAVMRFYRVWLAE